MIDELSGGTLQRVFLARTLAQTPDVILLDEPANHLDLKHQIELLDFIKKWISENNKTLIGVFHDLTMARRFCDSAVLLDNGTIAKSGKTEEVLNSETLSKVFDINIRGFMRESFELWK
jgi:iron complex transport system ATP-binding protein